MDLSWPYTETEFLALVDHLIPGFVADKRLVGDKPKHFQAISSLGASEQLEGLRVFAVQVSGSINKRVAIADSAFRLMKNTGTYRALVAFHADDTDQWRLSLLTAEPLIRDGRVVTSFSNPRRYSYVLGPKSKLATPSKWLVSKGAVSDFDELLGRFAIEVVNKEFYKGIAGLYDELVGAGGSDPVIKHPGSGAVVNHFAVRLIGRIIFCWFLREKKSAASIPLLPKEVLSREAAEANNYYNQTLAPLFFDILNKHPDERHDDHIVPPFDSIPYINGGLFDPKDDHWEYDTKLDKYDPDAVHIPDEWLRDLFDLLELYNFTVDENTSYDIELSIDPEMLGRIFENLLATINPETQAVARKETGSFYTPREIVEYMIDESLLAYLLDSTGIAEPNLRALISYNLLDDEEHPLSQEEQDRVVDALSRMRILDPACGSGAFPIGVLQKLVFMLDRVDPGAEKWFEKQLGNVSHELRRHLRDELERHNFDYLRKMGVIRESIYGVDIQPVAIEISRLRCFLTLIVDQSVDDDKPNRGIHPLPNLDFKFVIANTLVPLNGNNNGHQNGSSMFDDEEGIGRLQEIRDDYFSSHGHKREKLTIRFIATQNEMLREIIKASSKDVTEKTQKISSWNPFVHDVSGWFDAGTMFGLRGGFDIVIGNPPYIRVQRMNDDDKAIYSALNYSVFSKDVDLYCLFYEFGVGALKDGGVLSYITSNSWMRTKYGEPVRRLFMQQNPKQLVCFDNVLVFNSAVVATSIVLLQKLENDMVLIAANYKPSQRGRAITLSSLLRDQGCLLTRAELDVQAGWTIGGPDAARIRTKIESGGQKLGKLPVNIFYGIKTSYNRAFIVSSSTRQELINQDKKSADILKPVLRGKDIKSYCAEWAGLWLVDVHNGYDDIPPVQIDDYPAVKKHLDLHKKALDKRLDKGGTAYNLRDCAYYKQFLVTKIIWGELSDRPKFTLDTQQYFPLAGVFMMTGEGLKPLLGILNSNLSRWYFNQISTSTGMGTNMWKKYKIEQLPTPSPNPSAWEELSRLVDVALGQRNTEVGDEIDQVVYRLYGLDQSDIDVIEEDLAKT